MLAISSVSLVVFTRVADPPPYHTPYGLAQFRVDIALLVGILMLSSGVAFYLIARLRGASSSWDLLFLALFVMAMVYSVTASRILWNPLVFLPASGGTEPFHLGTARYLLVNGRVSGDVEYLQWPGSFIEVATLWAVLGMTGDQQLVAATLAFGAVCNIVIAMCIYVFSTFFLKSRLRALISTILYYISGFYFVVARSFFDPQYWAWTVFLVLYSCILLSPNFNRSRSIVFALLTAAIVIGHSITPVFLGFLLLALLITSRIFRPEGLRLRSAGMILILLVLFIAWSIYDTQLFEQEIPNILGLPLGVPFATFVFQTGIGAIGPIAQVPMLVTILRYYRILITLLPIGLSLIYGLNLLLNRTKQRSWVYATSTFMALLFLVLFQMTLLSQALPFFQRSFFLAFPFLAWMSVATLSKLKIRQLSKLKMRPMLFVGALLGLLVASSFAAPYLSVAYSYTYPELNATKFLTHSSNLKTATLGFQLTFWELIKYEEPTWGSEALPSRVDPAFYISPPVYGPYNRTRLNDYLQRHPTFYTAQVVARSYEEVQYYYAGLGVDYPEFWGRVDSSLNSPAYNRIYDSSWAQLYSIEGM
jgi:hypothetical protein